MPGESHDFIDALYQLQSRIPMRRRGWHPAARLWLGELPRTEMMVGPGPLSFHRLPGRPVPETVCVRRVVSGGERTLLILDERNRVREWRPEAADLMATDWVECDL